MKDLGKWQIISFISRGLAQVIGIAQGYIIARVLTTGEYGIVRIALSLGASLGIYQSLGLASASTREISLAKSDKEIFKILDGGVQNAHNGFVGVEGDMRRHDDVRMIDEVVIFKNCF